MFYLLLHINQDYINVEIIIKWKNTPTDSKSTILTFAVEARINTNLQNKHTV